MAELTEQQGIDRAHLSLSFAVFLSHLILESYGTIFSSRWLWRGLQESELTTSVALLRELATQDTSGVMSRMRTLARGSAADIVRALVKLELVVIDNGRPRLSMQGREFLDLKPWQQQRNNSAYNGSWAS